MDKRFYTLYEEELRHLRSMGSEFARDHSSAAGRLGGLDEFTPCRDPFVERLLEGFSFLAARVRLKLEAEFPRFTQTLLENVYPHLLCPTPSMALARFEPDLQEGGLAKGFTIPRNSPLLKQLEKGKQTRYQYRTAHDVTLWPLEITQAGYLTRDLGMLGLPAIQGVRAGIRIRLQATAGLTFREILLDDLTLHITGGESIPMHLYEHLFGDLAAVVIQPTQRIPGRQTVIDRPHIRQVGFDESESLLPYDRRSFQGYRLLQEYFSFPQRFMFFRLEGIGEAIRRIEATELDIVFLLRNANPQLEGVVRKENFVLFCTPAINLFPKRADRIPVSERYSEFHVVPDRTRPADFEVYKVRQVLGYGEQAEPICEFLPFYKSRGSSGGSHPAYYVVHRRPRRSEHAGPSNPKSHAYFGSEVFLSLVDASATPYDIQLKQLGVEALCSNRNLPFNLSATNGMGGFSMEANAPCKAIHQVGNATVPQPSYAEGEVAWRAISHLSLNYLSLADADAGSGASALQDILRLYAGVHDPALDHQIKGLQGIGCQPVVRRVPSAGAMAFVRGLEITVTLDETFFTGVGVFLFGAVLERFFGRYDSINSFTETVIRTVQRGEIMRWPMRVGERPIL